MEVNYLFAGGQSLSGCQPLTYCTGELSMKKEERKGMWQMAGSLLLGLVVITHGGLIIIDGEFIMESHQVG